MSVQKDKVQGDVIPNPVGMPCKYANSEKLRKEHLRWRNEIQTEPAKTAMESEYWNRISSCAAL